jgi:hypothetical protein
MQQQAKVFGLDATALSLEGFDPDLELLADRAPQRS